MHQSPAYGLASLRIGPAKSMIPTSAFRCDNAAMSDSQPISPRQRLQALLAVPEKQRTDAQWDEIIELEIVLAPGNREGAPDPNTRRNPGPQGGGHAKPGPGAGVGGHNKKQKRFHKRPPRKNGP